MGCVKLCASWVAVVVIACAARSAEPKAPTSKPQSQPAAGSTEPSKASDGQTSKTQTAPQQQTRAIESSPSDSYGQRPFVRTGRFSYDDDRGYRGPRYINAGRKALGQY